MAKLLAPYGATAARGRLAAVIFNQWRGIQYVKRFTAPAQPRTARQLLIRSYLTTLSRAWAALTAGQREAWATWASLHTVMDWAGNEVRMTGLNAYIMLDSRMMDMGLAAASSPPVDPGPANIVDFVPTGESGGISATWTATAGTDKRVDLWVQQLGSIARTPTINKASHNQYVNGELGTATISGLTAGPHAVFYRCLDETDGQASAFQVGVVTVT